MKTIITTILTYLGSALGTVLVKFLSTATEVVKYLNAKRADEKKEKEKQEAKEHNDKVKDACDNGSVEDLLNL